MQAIIKYFWIMVFSGCLITLCLAPGVSGAFYFDDYGTLVGLGEGVGINSWGAFWQFVLGSETGPGGRPIALATFVLNGRSWPTSPEPFLWTNIGIHLANAFLVFLFLTLLLSPAKKINPLVRQWLPALAALIWALHPYQVSTVLYVVQRMTSLSVLFQLLALITFLQFRASWQFFNVQRMVLWLFLGVVAFVFSYFTKEIALLLPLQLFVLEVFCGIVYGDASNKPIKQLRSFLIFPAAIVFLAYPLWIFINHSVEFLLTGAEPPSNRSFTLYERLMTQGRVLGDYLSDIFLPKLQTGAVFYDGYPVSTSLFQPVSTIIWWLTHLSLLAVSIIKRQRWPFLYLAVVWFYANHVLESSVFMLELKFEHRNYFALLGWVIGVVYVSLALNVRHLLRVVLLVAAISILAIMQYLTATLWGNPLHASVVWVEKNPYSTRALDNAANRLINYPETVEIALEYLRRAIEMDPSDPVQKVKYYLLNCKGLLPSGIDWGQLVLDTTQMKPSWTFRPILRQWLDLTVQVHCPAFQLEGFMSVLSALESNKNYKDTTVPYLVKEELVVAPFKLGQPDRGLKIFIAQNPADTLLTVAAQQALVVATYGYREQAADFLTKVIAARKAMGAESRYVLDQSQEIVDLIHKDIRENPTADPVQK